VFINGVGGLGAPYWQAACPIAFSGEADLPAETVAVIESIVFLLQANIEALDQAAIAVQRPATRIVVSGGLARLDGLCQRLADLSARKVERPATIEATAQGMAWLLNGVAPPRAAPAVFTPRPRPELHARYRRLGRIIASH
jgi:glycerol kinase